jgi:hypothetical protein
MLALQITAIVLLVLSFLLLFGPQVVAYGPRAIPALTRQREVRFVGGCLASLVVLAALLPSFGSAVVTGGQTMQMFAMELTGLSFGLV